MYARAKVWVKADGLVEVVDSPLILTQICVRVAPAVVCEGKVWVKTDGLVEVVDSLLVLTQVQVEVAPAVLGYSILWVQPDGLVVFSYGLFQPALLPKLYTNILVFISLAQTTTTG